MKEILYYDNLAEFNAQYYKDLLTIHNLVPGKIEIKKMSLPDGSSDDEYNFRGWELRKNDTKYLVSDSLKDRKIQIKELLPILPKHIEEVGAKGVVYSHVQKPITAKFKSERTMSFKELVDSLSGFSHTQPELQKLNWFIALASVLLRFNYRLSTPPGFGKDSTIDILGNLIGNCATIESPTLAKLEERANALKWLAVNEVIDIRGDEWRVIEQFLLASGAHKPTITKHSRAHGGVGETIDISQLSLSLLYNDITEYPKWTKYIDFTTKGAVLDRFPAFRFSGVLTEDFNKGAHMDNASFVRNNMEIYKKLIYNLTYYKENIVKEKHNYSTEKLIKMPSRWKTNMGRLLNIIDVYCDTQEEFNKYINIINNSIIEYQQMLVYTRRVPEIYSLLNIPTSIIDKLKDLNLNDVLSYLLKKKKKSSNPVLEYQIQFVKDIQLSESFINKCNLIDTYKEPNPYEATKNDDNFW